MEVEAVMEYGCSNTVQEHDEDRLAQFGYKQELRRDWGLAHNFGVSFSIISVITGITTLFNYGLNTGGPGVMSVGWILVSFFTMLVAIAMAEIVSAIPTSGGPYFWAAMLAPPHWSPFAAWLTGWFNLLGQVAVTTGISFGLAGLVATAAKVKNPDFEGSAAQTIGIYAAVLVSHGLFNTFGVTALKYLNNVSIFLHSAGVTAIAIAVLAKAPTHQSAKFVFATFYDGTGLEGTMGWSLRASPAYVAMCGVLMAQYTLTGFDASAHLSEETRRADWSAPIGVVSSVGFSSLFGLFVLLAFLFSIQDFAATLDNEYEQPLLKILVDVFGENGALAVFSITMSKSSVFSRTSTLVILDAELFVLSSLRVALWALLDDFQLAHDLLLRQSIYNFPSSFTTRATNNLDTTGPRHPGLLPQSRRPLPLPDPLHLAQRNPLLRPRPALPQLQRRLLRRDLDRHHRAVHILRPPHPHRTRVAPQLYFDEGALQPQGPEPVRRRGRVCLDRLHHRGVLSAHVQPGDGADAELYGRGGRDYRRGRTGELGLVGAPVVHRSGRGGGRSHARGRGFYGAGCAGEEGAGGVGDGEEGESTGGGAVIKTGDAWEVVI